MRSVQKAAEHRYRAAMRTIEEVRDQFAYHPASDMTAPQHAAVRDVLGETAERLWVLVPDGPEKTLALRALQTAQMYANLAIALQVPADTSSTRSVARSLLTERSPEDMVE